MDSPPAPPRGLVGDLFTVGLHGARPLEHAAFRLLESGIVPLGLEFPEYCGIQRGRWRLAAWRRPVALLGHRLNHGLAIHRLAGLGKDFRGRVDGAQLLGTRLLL